MRRGDVNFMFVIAILVMVFLVTAYMINQYRESAKEQMNYYASCKGSVATLPTVKQAQCFTQSTCSDTPGEDGTVAKDGLAWKLKDSVTCSRALIEGEDATKPYCCYQYCVSGVCPPPKDATAPPAPVPTP